MRRAVMTAWALVLALGAMGCGGDDATAPENLTAADLAGTWTGSTSQSRSLSFTVTSQGITSASLSYHLSGSVCSYDADVTVGSSSPVAITNGQFDTGTFPLGFNATLAATGRFTSRTAANGSLTISDGDCGGSVNLSWTATK